MDKVLNILEKIQKGQNVAKEEREYLESIKRLDLSSTSVSDISALGSLTNLTDLYLSSTSVSDISALRSLTNLTYLYLSSTSVSDISALGSLTNLTYLDLNSTSVSDISALRNLTNLTYLDLNSTLVSDISALRSLTNLTHLDLNSTLVNDISALENLTNLTYLDLSSTSVNDINALGNLTNLNRLYLISTSVSDISALGSLTNLTYLYLILTSVSDISALGNLTNLKRLYLNSTSVSDISVFRSLTSLTYLDLSSTSVSDISVLEGLTNLIGINLSSTSVNDIKTLGNLKKLKTLDLSYLELKSFPEKLLYMAIDDYIKKESFWDSNIIKCIGLNNTTFTTQPVSLLYQPRKLIKAYFDAPKIPVNEGKVIFLGHGDIGKSYTIQRILNNCEKTNYNTEMTPGIDINSYPAEYDGRRFDIRFWDFGGQDAMHAMHRCFLTQRTSYVVMISNRLPDLDGQARYWLRNIESFAGNSEVLLVVNCWEDYPYNDALNTNQLYEDFPNLVDCVAVSAKCDDKETFQSRLLKPLIKMAAKLDSIGMDFPVQWDNIRQKLLNMASQGEYYIDEQKYYEICAENDLTDPEIRKWLLQWFNDLGTCFSYHQDTGNKELKNYKIINPRWLTNAIYLLILRGKAFADDGVIKQDGIRKLLEHTDGGTLPGMSYSKEECGYILEVMRKFRLSFAVSETKEFLPALCPNQTPPNLIPDSYKMHLGYELEYKYLPDSVVHQLMIFCYQQLKSDCRWQKGMVVEIPSTGLSAIVKMDSDHPILKIDIYSAGSTPMWKLLQPLLHKIGEINTQLNIKGEDYVYAEEGGDTERFLMKHILSVRKGNAKRRPRDYVEGIERDYSITTILNNVYGPGSIENAEKSLEKEFNKEVTPAHVTNYVFYNCQGINLGHNAVNTVTVNQTQGISEEILKAILKKQRKLCKQDLEMFANILAEQTTGEAQKLGQDMKEAKTKKSMVEILSDRLQDGANLATIVQGIEPAISVIKMAVEKAPGLMNAIGDLIGKIPAFPLK